MGQGGAAVTVRVAPEWRGLSTPSRHPRGGGDLNDIIKIPVVLRVQIRGAPGPVQP